MTTRTPAQSSDKPLPFATWVLAPLAFNLVPVLTELAGLGSLAPLWFLMNVAALFVALISVLVRWLWRRPLDLTAPVLFGSTVLFGGTLCLMLTQPARRHAFSRLAERSTPLVRAIEAFERERGAPPAALEDLVPKYLDAVPGTGMPRYPEYEYSVFPSTTPTLLRWYDLGSRRGAPMTGLWKYPDGPGDHAILVVTTSSDGTVTEIETDRLAPMSNAVAFDARRWRADTSARARMLSDLGRSGVRPGASARAVIDLLGPPDGERDLGSAPWELSVPCSSGFLNWDVFVYWPGQRYPTQRNIERLGDWAYVHE